MELTIWKSKTGAGAGAGAGAGGELTVRDACSGALLYSLHRSGPSVKQIFLLKDKAALPILTLRPQQISSFHLQWKAVWTPNIHDHYCNHNITPFFTLKRSLLTGGSGFCVDVDVDVDVEKEMEMERNDYYSIKGSVWERSYTLYTRCGNIAAQVTAKSEGSGKGKGKGNEVLQIIIEKGFDVGLMVAVIVIVECINGGLHSSSLL